MYEHAIGNAAAVRASQPSPEPGSGSSASGYRHAAYAAGLAEIGRPRRLCDAGGWILERSIPGRPERDACGCYPLFACDRWDALPADLNAIGDGLVSLAVVTDPFGAYDAPLLRRAFRDVVMPFKQHFVVDLSRPLDAVAATHHRRNARRAHAAVAVERLADPAAHAVEWTVLYATLVRRHGVHGLAAFSERSLAGQLAVPGVVAFRATAGGATVGMLVWYVADGVAYYHLGAYTDAGYRLGASFALFWEALTALRGEADWASLGGAAGVEPRPDDGLARFKAGWSTGTRTAWFCGRVFDRTRYATLAAGAAGGPWFPAYRREESP